MIEEGKFDPDADSPLGLQKVKVRHSKAGTKTKKAAEPGVEEAEAAAPEAEGAEQKPKDAKPAKDEKK